jgi:hypothetical protein
MRLLVGLLLVFGAMGFSGWARVRPTIYSLSMKVSDVETSSIGRAVRKAVAPLLVGVPMMLHGTQSAIADMNDAPFLPGLRYEVINKATDDAIPKVGENVAIRFKGSYKGSTFDDTMSTPQPYFYRVCLFSH